MATYMQGALKLGAKASEYKLEAGYAVVSQSRTLTSTADGLAVAGTMELPVNSQIVNVIVDKTVNWVVGAGDATTIPVSVGSTVGGVEYLPASDMASVARAQLDGTKTTVAVANAIQNIGANTTVHLTIDPNGTIVTTQGVFKFTVLYVITQ